MNNNKINKNINSMNNKRTSSVEPEIDPALLDIISAAIDDGEYESNMTPAVDSIVPDGVKRVVRKPKFHPQNSKNPSQMTRDVQTQPMLISYVNEKNPKDIMYNSGHAFDQSLIQEAIATIRQSTGDKIHPTVFVRLTTKIHFTCVANHIRNPNARRHVPNLLGRVFFDPRTLNDLRMKTKDIKECISKKNCTDDDAEFRVYGLLAYLNNLIYDIRT